MIMTMIKVVFNAVVDDDYDDDEVIKASYVYEAVADNVWVRTPIS